MQLRWKYIAATTVVLASALAILGAISDFGRSTQATDLGQVRAPDAPADLCPSLPSNVALIGPPLTVAQVESESLRKMASTPSTPQVPFGYGNKEWVTLKALMRPGDTLHEYETGASGGHLVLRQRCFIGQINGWLR